MASAWGSDVCTLVAGRVPVARIVVCALVAFSLAVVGAGSASAAAGQQPAPGVEAQGPEGAEVPGEAEAPPTIAERQQPDQPVTVRRELPDLRTATSDTYELSDGSDVQRIASAPVNYRTSDGVWQPIEDQLVQGQDGSWSPQASPVPIALPASLASGPVSVGSGERQLSFQLQGAVGAEGRPAGSQRVYPEALPGADLTYAATQESLRETLTLKSADAPTEYRFSLHLSAGLHAVSEDGGRIAIDDAQGNQVYWIAAPTASDSAPDRPFPSHTPVHYELSADGSELTLVLDRAWLGDPARVFPVKIDPEVYFGTEDLDCPIISNAFASTKECGSHLYIGPDGASPKNVGRAILHFDTSSIPKGSEIMRSSLRMTFSWDTTSASRTIEARALEQSFTTGATWNTYDGTNAWATPGGDFEKPIAGERVVNHSEIGEELHFGFTPLVEQWVRDPSSNHGVLLKTQNETVSGYDAFAQDGNGEGAPEPVLEVIYEPRFGVPPMGQVYQQGLANGAVMSVNVANGNLGVTSPDVNYATEGYATELGREYNSQDDLLFGNSAFGDWRLNKGDDHKVYPTPWDGSVRFMVPGGGFTRFDRASWADNHPLTGDKAFTGEAGVNATLVEHEGKTRAMGFPGGVEWKFNNWAYGAPAEIVDTGGEGNTLSLTYASERLSELKDTHGHTLTLTREETSHDITKIKSGTETWKYAYKEGQLITVTNPATEKSKYTYYKTGTSTGLLESIADASGTWVVVYDAQKRVSSLRKLVNGTVKKAGTEDEITMFGYETEQTTVTNPLGEKPIYYYDQFGNIVEEPVLQAEAAEFYEGYASVEAEAARKAVDLQDHATVLDSQLQQQLGASYTGEWLNPETHKIALGVTAEGYERTVVQDLDNLGLADDGEVIAESASWSSLLSAQASIDGSLASLEESGLVSTGIDVAHDAVSVREANTLTPSQKTEVSSAASGAGVPTRIDERATANLKSTPVESQCEHSVCQKPLRGGAHIEWHPPSEPLSEEIIQCSAGFIVRSKYDKRPYLLTAGHCLYEADKRAGAAEAGWNSALPTDRETSEGHTYYSYGDRFIGHGHSYMYGAHHGGPAGTTAKGDAGIIAMEPEAFWSSQVAPLVTDYGVNEAYAIHGWATTPEPRQQYLVVCMSGAPYEKPLSLPPLDNPHYFGGRFPVPADRCGAVTAIHAKTESTNNKGEATNVYGLVEFNPCNSKTTTGVEDGMSGAPVFKAHFAYGVVEGFSGAGGCEDIYEPIGPALSELHVDLATG